MGLPHDSFITEISSANTHLSIKKMAVGLKLGTFQPKPFCDWTRGGQELEQAPQGSGRSTSLTELKKDLDNTLRHMVGPLGLSCQEMDLIILMGPFSSGYSMIL